MAAGRRLSGARLSPDDHPSGPEHQHGPPAALVHPAYIPTALAGAGVAFVVHIEYRAWDRVFLIVDAAAISLWATAGALITLAAGLGWLPAVLLGAITAVGDGEPR